MSFTRPESFRVIRTEDARKTSICWLCLRDMEQGRKLSVLMIPGKSGVELAHPECAQASPHNVENMAEKEASSALAPRSREVDFRWLPDKPHFVVVVDGEMWRDTRVNDKKLIEGIVEYIKRRPDISKADPS
jgi:hypothetical protein